MNTHIQLALSILEPLVSPSAIEILKKELEIVFLAGKVEGKTEVLCKVIEILKNNNQEVLNV